MATKEHSTHEMGSASSAALRSDRYGFKATKDKQLSFAHAFHICDCQSYRVKPAIIRRVQLEIMSVLRAGCAIAHLSTVFRGLVICDLSAVTKCGR